MGVDGILVVVGAEVGGLVGELVSSHWNIVRLKFESLNPV